MSTWTVVLLAGMASYALRLVPVVLLSRRALPAWLDRLGPLTAPVAFAALAAERGLDGRHTRRPCGLMRLPPGRVV